MPRWADIACACMLVLAASHARGESIAVEAINASTPTLCAESDNVYLKLLSPQVRRFTIEAVHPAYLPTLTTDDTAPDFGKCEMSNDPVFRFTPREVTIYDDGAWRLRGFVYPSFWRASQVPVRVGDRVETGLHLLQLWTRGRERDEEVLVLYPADGYWRARPLAPTRLGWTVNPQLPTAYGSSFLVGPIEQEGRPFVDLTGIVFDPAASSFHLTFARGGTATLRVDVLNQARIVLDVSLSAPVAPNPFAALRSMHVTPDNADVSLAAWRAAGAKDWDEAPVMDFKQARVLELWAGRKQPSHHNTSAPDMTFKDFSVSVR